MVTSFRPRFLLWGYLEPWSTTTDVCPTPKPSLEGVSDSSSPVDVIPEVVFCARKY